MEIVLRMVKIFLKEMVKIFLEEMESLFGREEVEKGTMGWLLIIDS